MRQSGCRLIGFSFGEKNENRGTVCGKSSSPGLWGGRRVTGAFTRNSDGNSAALHPRRVLPSAAIILNRTLTPNGGYYAEN